MTTFDHYKRVAMYLKLLSYLFPIKIFEKKSRVSKNLEIAYNNGKIVMDSANTNYSYGNLEKILKKSLQQVGYDEIRKMSSVLVLGVAGGCVIKTLVSEVGFYKNITGVEIDSEVITLANKYFKLNQIKNLEIVIADAHQFVLESELIYDLIIIDIFQDIEMPAFLFEKVFVAKILKMLQNRGTLIFNTMTLKSEHKLRNLELLHLLNTTVHSAVLVSKIIIDHNEIFIIKKKA